LFFDVLQAGPKMICRSRKTLFFLIGAFLILLQGCTTGPSLLTTHQDQTRTIALSPPRDDRIFNAPDSHDISHIKKQLIGFEVDKFGNIDANILLPQNQTVSDIIRRALTTGFEQAGFQVLNPDDAGYAQAPKINISIQKFHGWLNPGFWRLSLSLESEVTLSSDHPDLLPKLTIHNKSKHLPENGVTSQSWLTITKTNMHQLSQKLTGALHQKNR